MACEYFIGDNKYTEQEFKKLLSEGKLDEFINEGSFDLGKIPPSKPPVKESVVFIEQPKVELRFRGLQNVANEFGYEDVKSREPVSDIKEKQNARETAEKWAEEGVYNQKVEDLLTRINARELVPTAKQRLILQQHLSNEVGRLRDIKDIKSAEFDKQLKKVERIKEIGQIARQEAGAALRIGEGQGSAPQSHPLEDYADAFTAKKEANGVEELTAKQKADVEEAVKKYESATNEANEKIRVLEEENAKLKAAAELKKTTQSTPRVKKTKEEYAKIREDIKQSIKDKWKKASEDGTLTAVPVPYAKQLAAISPDVAKLVRSYVEEGVTELKDITKRIVDDIKGYITEITERDVHDIIAGEYNPKRPSRSDLEVQLRELKTEAELLNKLEKVKAGEPKTEKEKVERNQNISDLQKQLKELKKQTGYDDLSNLKAIKERNEKRANEINEKIKNKDFSDKEKSLSIFDDKYLQQKYPKEYKEAIDAIKKREDAKHEYDIQLLKDEYAKADIKEKAKTFVQKGAGTVKAIVTGIDDSGVAIQTYAATLLRPDVGIKALALHINHAFSQKRFDRWLTELHNSAWYPLIKDAGLSVTEPMSLKAAEKEEAFSNRFSGTIKIEGEEYKVIDAPLKPFERAFTTLGNASRVIAFKNAATQYMRQGYTFQNNPELFKSLANRLNTETGRGKENEIIRNASEIVTMGIWSPKLMASKFNILGISDIASLVLSKKGTKGYYSQLHPIERGKAIRDVVQFSGTVLALSYLVALSTGGDIDDDPESSTFLDIKLPSGKSVNLSGGFSGYIRTIAQFMMGRRKDKGKYKEVPRLQTLGRFFRGKTPPITGSAINLAAEKDYMGKPTTVQGEALKLVTPISVQGITQQIERDGTASLFTQGVPTFFGFNIKDDKDFGGVDKDLPTLLLRNLRSDEQDKTEFKNYKQNGREITDQEADLYTKKRDEYIKKRLESLWDGKDKMNKVVENGKVVIKKFKDADPKNVFTREQAADATTQIKSEATKTIKKQLFGEKKKTYQEKVEERKLKQARKQ